MWQPKNEGRVFVYNTSELENISRTSLIAPRPNQGKLYRLKNMVVVISPENAKLKTTIRAGETNYNLVISLFDDREIGRVAEEARASFEEEIACYSEHRNEYNSDDIDRRIGEYTSFRDSLPNEIARFQNLGHIQITSCQRKYPQGSPKASDPNRDIEESEIYLVASPILQIASSLPSELSEHFREPEYYITKLEEKLRKYV